MRDSPTSSNETKLAQHLDGMRFLGSAYRMQFGLILSSPILRLANHLVWTKTLKPDHAISRETPSQIKYRVFFQIMRSAKIYARSGWFVNLKQSIF
jgi:hypothetical protein